MLPKVTFIIHFFFELLHVKELSHVKKVCIKVLHAATNVHNLYFTMNITILSLFTYFFSYKMLQNISKYFLSICQIHKYFIHIQHVLRNF